MSASLRPADLGVAEEVWSDLPVEHVQKVAATLDDPRALVAGEPLPRLWHWAFFTPVAPTAALGTDGHPRLPADGPMAQLPRRMWAGGVVRWERPLRIGEPTRRRTRVGAVEEKLGRSGRLLIVTLHHVYGQDRKVNVVEEQNLVYREPAQPATGASAQGTGAPASPAPAARATEPHAAFRVHHDVDEPLLQRYSAVTFNAHRIHYDRPYAMDVEGYGGLVVHGPLLATLVTAAAGTYIGGASSLRSITYRGVAPATAPGTITITIDPRVADSTDPATGGTDATLEGCARRADGTVVMEATFAAGRRPPKGQR